MSEPFLGEVRLFGFNYAPNGWALCNGQLLSIAQNSALFSLLSTYYGGEGVTTFGVPNLQGRAPVGFGQGTGLSPYVLGQSGGTETVTLTSPQMPLHSHMVGCAAGDGDVATAVGSVPGGDSSGGANPYSNQPPAAAMSPQMILPAGGSQPHPNLPPYLALNFCIATEGLYPSRP